MEEAKMVLLEVVIYIGVAAALFTGLDVFLALPIKKAARCSKSKYFNVMYRPGYGAKFCRAHLVGEADRSGDKMLYLVEIHPKDADKAWAWTVPEAELRGGHLLVKGRFYRYAFKEEVYD